MFVKLLVILFSYVFVSFSVLLCCKTLTWKYGLKGVIKQKENVVLVSVLDRTRTAIERAKTESSALALKPRSHDQAHSTLN